MSTGVGFEQSGKSGGDALGMAGAGSTGIGGSGSGVGTGVAAGFGAPFSFGSGSGTGGDGTSYAGSAGAYGGDIGDNTAIGSININS